MVRLGYVSALALLCFNFTRDMGVTICMHIEIIRGFLCFKHFTKSSTNSKRSHRSLPVAGFLDTDGSASVNSLNFAAPASDDKPMFLYGERQVSRKVGKFRRIQSAMVKGRNHRSKGY